MCLPSICSGQMHSLPWGVTWWWCGLLPNYFGLLLSQSIKFLVRLTSLHTLGNCPTSPVTLPLVVTSMHLYRRFLLRVMQSCIINQECPDLCLRSNGSCHCHDDAVFVFLLFFNVKTKRQQFKVHKVILPLYMHFRSKRVHICIWWGLHINRECMIYFSCSTGIRTYRVKGCSIRLSRPFLPWIGRLTAMIWWQNHNST